VIEHLLYLSARKALLETRGEAVVGVRAHDVEGMSAYRQAAVTAARKDFRSARQRPVDERGDCVADAETAANTVDDTTNLDCFNTNPNGDLPIWASGAGDDSFRAFSPSGEADLVSQTDITEMRYRRTSTRL